MVWIWNILISYHAQGNIHVFINYLHYITNQISKPVCQVFALELEKIPNFKENEKLNKRISTYRKDKTDKNLNFIRAEKEKITRELLFGEIIRTVTNTMNNQADIRSFFKKKVIIPS